jgi:hypothetical protein
MSTANRNLHLGTSQPNEIDPWDAPLPDPIFQAQPHLVPIDKQPILSPAGIPRAAAIAATPSTDSPTVQSLLRWGLKLSPTSLSIEGLRDAIALLVWQASVLCLSQQLIEDELKLKDGLKGTLRTQIQKALALLFWLSHDGEPTHA